VGEYPVCRRKAEARWLPLLNPARAGCVHITAVRAELISRMALTRSNSACLAFSDGFRIFFMPFMGKFIQLFKSATDFLHTLG
jgi:hypothetical protein